MTKMEQAFDRANKSAETYALITTNLEHVEKALSLAQQFRADPKYIERLEACVAELKRGAE